MGSADVIIRELLRDTRILGELAQVKFQSHLTTLAADDVVRVLSGLQDLALRANPFARQLLVGVVDVAQLERTLGAPRVHSWRQAAERLQLPGVVGLLTPAVPRRTYFRPGHTNINEQMEDVPLGRRKALAREHNREVLLRVMNDKHPDVIDILLSNPRLVEADVVQMAAARPTTAAALRVISRHPRWSLRAEVRLALTHNPYSPPEMVLGLLPTLALGSLRHVAEGQKLHLSIRIRARELLAERGVRVNIPQAEQERERALGTFSMWKGEDEEEDLASDLTEGRRVSLASPLAEESADGEEEANELAAAFMAGLGELNLTPVAEVDEVVAVEVVEEVKKERVSNFLRAYTTQEEDAIAEDFLSNLGELQLVPVGEDPKSDEEELNDADEGEHDPWDDLADDNLPPGVLRFRRPPVKLPPDED